MSLKVRLIIAFASLTVMMIILLSIIFGKTAIQKMENALKTQAKQELTAKKHKMRKAVQNYFKLAEKQIIAMSNDIGIIDATKQFSKTFSEYQNNPTSNNIGIKLSVKNYYQNEFRQEYVNKNNELPNINGMIEKLDNHTFIMQYEFISNNPHPLGEKDKLISLNSNSQYNQIHKHYHPSIRKFQQQFGFYDIFIIEPKSGKIVYSVFKELDFATDLYHGPYANTGIAKAFKQALKAEHVDQTFITDFDAYLPSYNEQASFISSPIFEHNQLIGILVFQLPINKLNNLLSQDKQWQSQGYGETGEISLVGSNQKRRNESRFFIEDSHGYFKAIKQAGIADSDLIRRKNTTINLQTVNTKGVTQALAGKSGFAIYPNYRNVPVLSAYAPVKVGEMTWAILSEINQEEALRPAKQLTRQIWLLTLSMCIVLGLISTILAVLLAKYLLKPLNQLSQAFANIAQGEGDLTHHVPTSSITEINAIGEYFNQFVDQMRNIINEIKQNAQTLAKASESLGSNTERTTKIAKQQKQETDIVVDSMSQFNQALKEITQTTIKATTQTNEAMSSTNTNTKIAEQAADNIRHLTAEVESSSKIITELQQEILNIDSILEVINGIADQTNLLALNAAIEAARAKEHGRGFSVVAEEVRSLAARTQESTIEIQNKISDLTQAANRSVNSMQQANNSAQSGITLVEQVSAALNQLKTTINILTSANQTVSAASEEQKNTSHDITNHLGHINEMSTNVEQASDNIAHSVLTLHRLSKQTNELVQRFNT